VTSEAADAAVGFGSLTYVAVAQPLFDLLFDKSFRDQLIAYLVLHLGGMFGR